MLSPISSDLDQMESHHMLRDHCSVFLARVISCSRKTSPDCSINASAEFDRASDAS